ncbi:hypothetical protein Tco_0566298 [Tanacetum coccineum]
MKENRSKWELLEQRFIAIMGYRKKKWGMNENDGVLSFNLYRMELGGQGVLVLKLGPKGEDVELLYQVDELDI